MSRPWLTWDGASLEPGWQGIVYLSIALIPSGQTLPGARLTVHLNLPPSGISAEDVVVMQDGKPLTEGFTVAIPGAAPATIDILFEAVGDHGPHQVMLASGGDDNLNPFFSLSEFIFLLQCETGDCRQDDLEADARRAPAPALDLLTKDFTGFVKLLAERVQVVNPDWSDLSAASMERVFIDLLAHQGDMLSYYQDRVASEAFLQTATQRFSLRQHGALLGYALHDGQAAQTLLSVDVAAAGFVPEGLQVRTEPRAGEAPLVFSVTRRTAVDPLNNSDKLHVAAWPDANDARLVAGSTEMLLWGQSNTLRPGDRLALVHDRTQQVVTLTAVEPLNLPGWVKDPDDAPTGTVPLTAVRWQEPLTSDYPPWQGAFEIRANLVDAVHGEWKTAWLRPSQPAAVLRDHVEVVLNRRNSITTSVARAVAGGATVTVVLLRALRLPQGPVAFDRDANHLRRPALEVTIDGEAWHAVEHLHNAFSYDRHFVATTDNNGHLWLQFGDGIRGHEIELLPSGQPAVEIKIRYRVGSPLAGNCQRGVLQRAIAPQDPNSEASQDVNQITIQSLTNVIPALGAAAAESNAAARLAIPASLRHGDLERAVTLSDYAAVAEQVSGVARAAAVLRGGIFNTVIVLVDPIGQVELTQALKEAVIAHMESRRMTGREVRVQGPDYLPLDVELIICVQTGFQRHRVRDRVLATLQPGRDDRPGFFHPDRLSFGEDIELGDVLAAAHRVPGVRSVHARRFRPLRSASTVQVFARIGLADTEVARLDATPGRPEHGRLKVLAVGLDNIDESEFLIDEPSASP
ncbi:MAG: hypothetical protein AAFV53_11680 [Myxococcota bacterium]